jgi:hypothetical protein
LIATGLELQETLAPTEQNGFTLIDFTRERIDFRVYAWKMGRAESEIDNLQPFHTFQLAR